MKASPLIFGILNITEDSFSDGGKYIAPERARKHADYLIQEGASVIDAGPASSNPYAAAVPAEVQIERLASVWNYLKEKKVMISADVCLPEVQIWAAENGADFINDIDGFRNPEVIERLAGLNTRLIVMHSLQQSGRADTRYADPDSVFENIFKFFYNKTEYILKAGIRKERIILDPGLGFFLGRNYISSVKVLRNLQQLKKEFPFPFLISPARKSFLGEITGRPASERDAATLAAEIYAVYVSGADMIRTHNPGALSDALKVWNALHSSNELDT